MSDIFQLIESMDAERASIQKLFGDEGAPVHEVVQKNTARRGPKYQEKLAEAVQFIKQVWSGRRPMWQLKEALSTSDFPLLFGDTIDRMMVAQYRMYDPTFERWMRISTVPDFRSVKRFRTSDGDQRLGRVRQGDSYPQGELDESTYSFSVAKYGRQMDILWEALVNDDLDALRDIPARFARAARRTEMYFASSLYVANSTLYSASHSVNGINYSNTGTAALSITALKAAWNAMLAFPDEANSDGLREPIFNRPAKLVVDPLLELTALEILNTIIVQWTDGTSSGPTPQATNNQLAGRLTVEVDPYMSIVDATNGATSWYLFADPADGYAVEFARLRGYEEPQMFMKSPNSIRLGGGESDPMQGDFDTDNVAYKVRHVVGGSHANAVGGWRFTYRSTGAG